MRFLTQAILPLELNIIEVVSVVVALAGLAWLGRLWRWSRTDLMMVLLLSTPVLLLTVAETTQFMTMDEWGLSMMLLNPNDRLVHQFLLGAFHTGGLIQLTLAKVCEQWGAEPDLIRMLLKAVWWLLGNSLLFVIAVNVLRLAGLSVRRSAVLLATIFAALALLPTSQLAIKTLNYDLFSAGCGVLAILLTLRAFEERREGFLVSAIVVASFGAQEKLTVGPVLIALVILWALWRAVPVAHAGRRALIAMGWAIIALTVPLCISLSSLSVFASTALTTVPEGFYASSVDLLSSWIWVPLGLVLPIDVILAHRLIIAVAAAVVIVLFVGAAAVIAPSLIAYQASRKMVDRLAGPVLPSFVMLTVFVIGAVTAITVVPYWAPFHPSSLPELVCRSGSQWSEAARWLDNRRRALFRLGLLCRRSCRGGDSNELVAGSRIMRRHVPSTSLVPRWPGGGRARKPQRNLSDPDRAGRSGSHRSLRHTVRTPLFQCVDRPARLRDYPTRAARDPEERTEDGIDCRAFRAGRVGRRGD